MLTGAPHTRSARWQSSRRRLAGRQAMVGVGLQRGRLPCFAATGAAPEEAGDQPLLAGFGAALVLPLAVDGLDNVFIHEHRFLSFSSPAPKRGRRVTGRLRSQPAVLLSLIRAGDASAGGWNPVGAAGATWLPLRSRPVYAGRPSLANA